MGGTGKGLEGGGYSVCGTPSFSVHPDNQANLVSKLKRRVFFGQGSFAWEHEEKVSWVVSL